MTKADRILTSLEEQQDHFDSVMEVKVSKGGAAALGVGGVAGTVGAYKGLKWAGKKIDKAIRGSGAGVVAKETGDKLKKAAGYE